MKILILAYASEPGTGSEYGVGWMVPTVMAKRYPEHDIYVLTRSRCREKIEASLSPSLSRREGALVDSEVWPNLHFLFYDIPSCLFYKKEMGSNWGEQYNYLLWELFARRFVKKMHKKIGFDIIHHLTFNQYRTPSPGYWMKVPFVVGPIGGAETIPPALWQDLEEHTRNKEEIRLKGKDLKVFRWFNTRSGNRKVILCSCTENAERLRPYSGDSEVRVMPAIAFDHSDFSDSATSRQREVRGNEKAGDDAITINGTSNNEKTGNDAFVDGPFTMIYAGKAYDWKGIRIFLRSLSLSLSRREEMKAAVKVKLIGIRFEEEQKKVMGWVNELGLTEQVELIPFIKRADLLKMEAECDLAVYPAFRDSGSMSVLEACALGCPSICFDAGGQDIFPDDILLKIKVGDTYDECLDAFAARLSWAMEHRDDLKAMGLKAKTWVEEHLTWDSKVEEFMEIYRELAL